MSIQYRAEDKVINTKNSLMSTVRYNKSYNKLKYVVPLKVRMNLLLKYVIIPMTSC